MRSDAIVLSVLGEGWVNCTAYGEIRLPVVLSGGDDDGTWSRRVGLRGIIEREST